MQVFRKHSLAWLAGFVLVPGLAFAADGAAYPSRPITLVVPYGPGGPTDIIGRIAAEGLRQELGQPVVVENRPGAGGNIGAAAVARAAPDGYTLLVAASAFTINPSLYRKAGYDPVKEFTPIGTLAQSPNVILAGAGAGLATLQDMVTAARARPGSLNYASPGAGTIPQLAMELFKYKASVDIVHIPYNSAGAAVTAALASTTPLAVSALPPALPQIKAGKLVPLAVTSRQRSPDLPDTPTVEQAGYSDFDLNSLQILVGPANLPPAVQARLVQAVSAMQAKPELGARVKAAGFALQSESPEVLAKRIERETAMWSDLIGKTGISAE